MIAPLRRRHKILWRIIAPLLFILAITAYVMAPKFPNDSFSKKTVTFPNLVSSIVNENYVFSIRKNLIGEQLLEVTQISNINPVSELVLLQKAAQGNTEITEARLGMMGSKSTYYFNLNSIAPPFSITVIDTIKRVTLAKINF